mgnify:CR=1 FL=1
MLTQDDWRLLGDFLLELPYAVRCVQVDLKVMGYSKPCGVTGASPGIRRIARNTNSLSAGRQPASSVER